MFCKIVSNVLASRGPVDSKLALVHAVADPIEAHVNRFRADLFHSPVHNSAGGRVIGFDGRSRLWMAHFGERLANDGTFFGVEE